MAGQGPWLRSEPQGGHGQRRRQAVPLQRLPRAAGRRRRDHHSRALLGELRRDRQAGWRKAGAGDVPSGRRVHRQPRGGGPGDHAAHAHHPDRVAQQPHGRGVRRENPACPGRPGSQARYLAAHRRYLPLSLLRQCPLRAAGDLQPRGAQAHHHRGRGLQVFCHDRVAHRLLRGAFAGHRGHVDPAKSVDDQCGRGQPGGSRGGLGRTDRRNGAHAAGVRQAAPVHGENPASHARGQVRRAQGCLLCLPRHERVHGPAYARGQGDRWRSGAV